MAASARHSFIYPKVSRDWRTAVAVAVRATYVWLAQHACRTYDICERALAALTKYVRCTTHVWRPHVRRTKKTDILSESDTSKTYERRTLAVQKTHDVRKSDLQRDKNVGARSGYCS